MEAKNIIREMLMITLDALLLDLASPMGNPRQYLL